MVFQLTIEDTQTQVLMPKLKNLSRVSNLSCGLNMVWSTWNWNQDFEIWSGAQVEPVFDGSVTQFKVFKYGLWFEFTKESTVQLCDIEHQFTPDYEVHYILLVCLLHI